MKRTYVAALILSNLIIIMIMTGSKSSVNNLSSSIDPPNIVAFTADTRAQDYYTLARQYNRQVYDGIKHLKLLQAEWNAGNYGSTLPAGSGANAGVTRTQLGAVIFDTADALDTKLTENSGGLTGNMQALF